MNSVVLEVEVEKIINNEIQILDNTLFQGNNRILRHQYSTAKRLIKFYKKYREGSGTKDDFLVSLRNYLLLFQNSIRIDDSSLIEGNLFGIKQDVDGKYFAVMDLPEYVSSTLVESSYMRNINIEDKVQDYFLGTNSFIYRLTGFKQFKSIEQKIAIFGALNTPDGYTSLVSLPTGGGKSLITQTMSYQKEGLTIVIVPTVSLAIDQVRSSKININHNTDNEIFCYYSGIDEDTRIRLMNSIKSRNARMLFISPEALIRNSRFKELIEEANIQRYLKNIIIDEAHIVIEWGTFFRVDYQCLEPWRKSLLIDNSQLRTVLLSATFEKSTVNNLKKMFSEDGKWIEVRCDSLRKEPRFALVSAKSYSEKNRMFIELVRKLPHPIIIYVTSPDRADTVKSILEKNGFGNIETFTGKTKPAERERIIKCWTEDEFDIMVATSAFGVGVDKPNVRTVLHLYVPENPNKYYQELGRGGRDGLPSLSVMCIEEHEDLDSAYAMTDKVMLPDKILGRWTSMYNSTSSVRYKDTVTLDTSVKPSYNSNDYAEDASKVDIQWNVYVILFLRRYNMINILDMVYDFENEKYLIRVQILQDLLRSDGDVTLRLIRDYREKEWNKFENDFIKMRNIIVNSRRRCLSEMFYSTYDKVYEYCAGCNQHNNIVDTEKGRFPLVVPIREPYKNVSNDFNILLGNANEMLIISEEEDYTLYNALLKKGVSSIVVESTDLTNSLDMLINTNTPADVNIMGIKEYKELLRDSNSYFVSGTVMVIYESASDNSYEVFSVVRKYASGKKVKLVHIMNEDKYFQELSKRASAIVEGPSIDGYLIERM